MPVLSEIALTDGIVQRTKLQPNASTYGAIVDACVRNGDKPLALKTYRQALDAGLVDSQHIYTSSIAACVPDKDSHTALSIFHEMLRYNSFEDGVLITLHGLEFRRTLFK